MECHRPCRVNVTIHRDGRVERTEAYCENRVCPLHGRNQRFLGTAHDDVTLYGDGSFTHSAAGRADQNEDNVPRVAGAFVNAAQRQGEPLAGYRVVAEDSRASPGVDCEILDDSGQVVQQIQVTRAPLNDLWQEQSRLWKQQRQEPAVQRLSLERASALLRRAIGRKAGAADQRVDLVIDGTHAVELAFLAPRRFAIENLEWLGSQGWRAIWVVGPFWRECLWKR